MTSIMTQAQQIQKGKRYRISGVLTAEPRGYRLCVPDGMRWRVTAPEDLSNLVGRPVVVDGIFEEPTLLAADYVGAQ